ncbi:diguanylate cyclase domain-containing protein [Pseudofrankia sp. BMG5.37]|uniref:diguanylate cyclase domain-containing protein n=1 Tax=Pseudofrankia sp. BMG5.37 TaxID=3050035 RepID=UPI0028959783|nr:diguanylate cyclase [Pseudofrankia sp. BMG5.37]MDT3442265.1 diguanylate cyclase [Pseudofrankia sp. BMG5.37]
MAVACAVLTLAVVICAVTVPTTAATLIVRSTNAASCLAAAVCMAWTGWRTRGADRRWRLIIAPAAAVLAATSAWYAQLGLRHGEPFPPQLPASAAGFVLTAVLALAGVLAFPTDPLNARRTDDSGSYWYAIVALDSLAVVGSVATLLWSVLLTPIARSAHIDIRTLTIPIVATLGSLLLLVGVLLLGTVRRPRSGLALGLLGAGMAGLTLTLTAAMFNIAAGGRGAVPVTDVGFVVGWLLIFLSGLVPIRAARPSDLDDTRPQTLWMHAVLPYVALGAVGALAVGQTIAGTPISSVERDGLLGLLVVVLIRQVLTLRDNARLLASIQASRRDLHYQASHDPLTGLANRALFTDRLRHTLTQRDDRPFALLFCDLDNFKQVNDTFGHPAGDELLRITARRLRDGVRSGDTVARLGGDEFAVIFENSRDGPGAESLSRRLAATIRAPCTLAGHRHRVGASLGLVLASRNGGADAETLQREADLAMYAAKRQRKGELVVYRPDLTMIDTAPRMSGDLTRLLHGEDDAGTLDVAYRPVVHLRDGRTVAADAEPRWRHPGHGEIPSGQLRQLADEARLADGLLWLTLQRVCGDLATTERRSAPVPVLVTIPLDAILDRTPLTDIAALLPGPSPCSLILTLAGTRGGADLAATVPALLPLTDRGAALALDGVGENADMFAACRVLPIRMIRMHHSMTDTGATDRAQIRQVRDTILAAAARLELIVTATGINDHTQARELALAGCDLGTGPLYGQARPLADL